MGIQGLSEYLKKRTKCYVKKHLSQYSYKTFAVDISVFLYKTIRSRGEKDWIFGIIGIVLCLRRYKIKPIFIFDGPNFPKEKIEEREERRSSSKKVKEKAENIKQLLETAKKKVQNNEKFSVNFRNEIYEMCKKQSKSEKFDTFDFRDRNETIKVLESTYDKFSKQCISIEQKHVNIVKDFLQCCGIPFIQADGEAEALCSILCIENKVDAVLTEDTDVLAYGSPVFLSGLDLKTETVNEVLFQNVLIELDLSKSQFLDFCIMCQCDYNKRIKIKTNGTKNSGIGPVKAMLLIKKHNNIEGVDYSTDYDTTPLKYNRCREIFTMKLDINYSMDYTFVDFEKIKLFLTEHNCLFFLDQIHNILKPPKLIFINETEESIDCIDSSIPVEETIYIEKKVTHKRLLPSKPFKS